MLALGLHAWHEGLGARFGEVGGAEVVETYGDARAEYEGLRRSAGLLDLSFRTRLCLLGRDRVRFLNGQATQDIQKLGVGEGGYTTLVTAQGRMVGEANVYCLPEELLLDGEPGMGEGLRQRFERHRVADEVEVADAAPHFGLLSVQGPAAGEVWRRLGWEVALPAEPFGWVTVVRSGWGELYLMNQPRLGGVGFDLFVPQAVLAEVAERLAAGVAAAGGRWVGWQALEWARVESGIPRWGADLDGRVRPPEAGLEARAISYRKGCYIGQEVMARLRTYGQVAKRLRGLRLAESPSALPARGDRLVREGREVGYLTSVVRSPALESFIALGYVRRGEDAVGNEFAVAGAGGEGRARIVALPFVAS